MTPLGTPTASVGAYVAAAVEVIRESGLRFRLNPMGTTVQGPLRDLLRLIPRLHDAVFRRGALRVSTLVKLDERRDRPSDMEEKVRSVRRRLAPRSPRRLV
ncbi:hypothetical protein HRbin32_01529 [bacterium HR32]|nr:hypothetical protein HRbin32_01529 [bacterium HR32]